ncbi:GNAT family N-acetyltransferase [Nocardioides sp.]|uniref:GNAT family N-acetyltransferase n=1 Tax=Nocardioides sp. TaxID=35761 RepID=UPI002717E39B|nr:GNAT family N-acetyltransferase [Nocardioides sp.]MDO9457376.1 GNAT family N-acetyltransferase [Nocardioides sp.]
MSGTSPSVRAVVRTATQDDLEAILHIGHECWRTTYVPITGPDYVERGLAGWWTPETNRPAIDEGRVLVAEVDGLVLGMASTSVADDHVVVWRLYVLPEAHGQGLGTLLLEAVEAAAPLGTLGLRLSHLEGNDRARGFYEHLGFVATGERKPSTIGGPDDLWMQRPLQR